MKKKQQPLEYRLKMPRVFRDDIQEVERILVEELKTTSLKISTKEYEYKSVGEMPKKAVPMNELDIYSYDTGMSIYFWPGSSKISLREDSLEGVGAFTKIVDLLKKREHRVMYYCVEAASWTTPPPFIGCILGAAALKNSWSLLLLAMAFTLLVWYIWSFRKSTKRYSVIELVDRVDRPGFFKRKRDDIVISTASTLFGAILGVIGTLVVKD